jgi:hypothetical protein
MKSATGYSTDLFAMLYEQNEMLSEDFVTTCKGWKQAEKHVLLIGHLEALPPVAPHADHLKLAQ